MRLFNSLSRQVEEVVPLEDRHVRMYTCGPTVCRYMHLGNLRTFMLADLIRRALEYEGLQPLEIAEKYMKAALEDASAVGIREPEHLPKATEHVPEMIDLTKKLV